RRTPIPPRRWPSNSPPPVPRAPRVPARQGLTFPNQRISSSPFLRLQSLPYAADSRGASRPTRHPDRSIVLPGESHFIGRRGALTSPSTIRQPRWDATREHRMRNAIERTGGRLTTLSRRISRVVVP